MRRVFTVVGLILVLGIGYLFLADRSESEPGLGVNVSNPSSEATPTLRPLAEAATATADPTTTRSTPSPTANASDNQTAPAPAPPAADDLVDPHGDVVPPGEPAQPRDDTQRERFIAYEKTATEFMTAFARPNPTEEEGWWGSVKPHLSARIRADYESVDPARVPFTAITGPAAVIPTDAPSDLLTAVLVPTDAGDYTVETETDEDGIHVTRLVPPSPGDTP